MKSKIQLTIIFFLLVLLKVNGQIMFKEFGKISKEEIELTEYDLDKSAEAVVIFDIGKSRFLQTNSSFELAFERTTRIKILSESGIKWAEVEIPLYQQKGVYDQIIELEAFSYNYENGILNKTPLNLTNVFDVKINNNWNVKKFAIPNVKIGTIIEYKYKIHSQHLFNLQDWEFQWRIPVNYSEYMVSMVPFYEYSWLLQGANKFDSQKSYVDNGLSRQFGSITYQDMVHTYIMKNIPAFNSEEFITSINDYIIKIDFQLSRINYPTGRVEEIITTWEDLNKEFIQHKDFGKYINKTTKLAPKYINIDSLKLRTDKEKFDHILEYVKQNHSWNKINSKFASKTPNKFIEDKQGNSADINLFAIGLLNAAGIDAKPIIISTRDNGKIKYNYPYTQFFNYVIIRAIVDGEIIISDATEVLSLNNRIPSRCINDKGLIIQKDKIEWITLESITPSIINTNIDIQLTNSLSINANISKHATEYDALHFRSNYTDNIDKIKKNLERPNCSILDSSIVVQNQYNKNEPYILTYNQTSNPEIHNEKVYLSPFLKETIYENPLTQNERTYPIDMTYPKKRTYNATIVIPEGYEVEYIPSTRKMNTQLFELSYSARIEENKVIVSFDYFFKNSVYAASDYLKIKSYFNEIVKKGNESIIVKKKVTKFS